MNGPQKKHLVRRCFSRSREAYEATVRTPFYLTPPTKPFTTTTLMALVAEERVDLDAPGNRDLAGSGIKGPNGNPDGAPPKHSIMTASDSWLTEHSRFRLQVCCSPCCKKKRPRSGDPEPSLSRHFRNRSKATAVIG
jgi:hypothetical protein